MTVPFFSLESNLERFLSNYSPLLLKQPRRPPNLNISPDKSEDESDRLYSDWTKAVSDYRAQLEVFLTEKSKTPQMVLIDELIKHHSLQRLNEDKLRLITKLSLEAGGNTADLRKIASQFETLIGLL